MIESTTDFSGLTPKIRRWLVSFVLKFDNLKLEIFILEASQIPQFNITNSSQSRDRTVGL